MNDREILRELAGETCRCKAHKSSGNSLCLSCWKSLPQNLRNDLYKRFGKGYEEAYEAALQYLGYGPQPALFEAEVA